MDRPDVGRWREEKPATSRQQRAMDELRSVEAHVSGAGAWLADLEELLVKHRYDTPEFNVEPLVQMAQQARAAFGRAVHHATEARVVIASPGPLLRADEARAALEAIDAAPEPTRRLTWLRGVIAAEMDRAPSA
jgi:hypothetical protein